jgi:hypothetical protein
MTDFLSSLVERSFGTAPAIRPRVSSLFEPVSSRASSAAIETELSAREPIDRAEEHVSSVPEESRASSPSAASLHEDIAGVSAHVPVRHVPSSSDRTVDVKPATLWAAMREITPEPKADHRVVTPDRTQEEAIDAPQRSEIATARVTSAPADASQRGSATQPMVPISAEPRVPAIHDRGLVVPSTAATRVAADLRQAAAAWHGTARHHHRDDAHAIATPIPAPSDRDVHVTIGRIEVRAVSSGRAPARERSTSPVMSLDAYLRRQARRGAE